MGDIKIALIGAGSTYTPEFIEGILLKNRILNVDEIAFFDIDLRRLDILYNFSLRMVAKSGCNIRISCHSNLSKAVEGADFIVNQIRVAGQKGRIFDERLGISLGIIGQETTGVGGFSKAMRTIPVVLKQCRIYEKLAKNAFLINFTNPSGIITEAILRHTDMKCLGLCNIPINLKMDIANYFGLSPEKVEIDYIGLNHLGWVRSIKVGNKVLRLNNIKKTISDFSPSNIPDMDYPEELLEALSAFPGYYLRYFYLNREMIKKQKKAKLTRGEEVLRIEKGLLRIYSDKRVNDKPELLSKRGGAYYSKVATSIIDSIVNDRNNVDIVNIANNGALKEFENEEVLELPAILGKDGAKPIPNSVKDIHMLSLMRVIKGYERLTIEAAIEKSFNKAVLALVTNPLIMDANIAIKAVKEINKRYKLGLK